LFTEERRKNMTDVEMGAGLRRAEIAKLARAQARDEAASKAGKVIRENWMTSSYGLQGGALALDDNVRPAEKRGSDSTSARVATVLLESVKIT
jgi:hypothetical protein